MTTVYAVPQLELEARALINKSREADAAGKLPAYWSQRQTVRRVFEAMWSNALTAERVTRIGLAMEGLVETEEQAVAIQRALTSLVREKLLRSRRHNGHTLYELDFTAE